MKRTKLTLFLIVLCFGRSPLMGESSPPEPLGLYLHAIAQIESGDNPTKVGRHGERTRWQIRQTEWEQLSAREFKAADDTEGRRVAAALLSSRIQDFESRHLRPPTAQEVYLLWHRPARVLSASPVEKERAERFANLYEFTARRVATESVEQSQ